MFIRNLLGNNVLRDETDEIADAGGSDRGDDHEVTEDEEEEIVASEEAEESDKDASEKSEEEAKPDKKKPAMVPQKRMKEAVDKERKAREASEAKLKEAEEKIEEQNRGVDTKKLASDIEDLDELLDKAIADGDAVAKKRIRGEIREKQMTLARAEAAALSAQATAIAVERVRYDALVERLEKDHPAMNPEDDAYDEEVIAEIVDLKSAYEAKGDSSSEALKKAAKYVFKQQKAEAKEEKEEVAALDDDEESEEAQALREKAIKRAQEAKRRQPASTDKGGKASDKSGGGMKGNVDKLSDDEFDKLDPKDIARLRGDHV